MNKFKIIAYICSFYKSKISVVSEAIYFKIRSIKVLDKIEIKKTDFVSRHIQLRLL